MNLDDIFKALVFGAILLIGAGNARADAPVDATVKLGDPTIGPMCSGTVIAPDTVVTAAHCVDVVTHVRGNDGGLYKIEGGKVGDGVDGAVLWVPGVACPCAPVGAPAAVGDKVRAIGFPSGVFSDTYGVVLGVEVLPLEASNGEYPNQREIFNSAEIAPGSSGGGLWRLDGDQWVLVGVTVHGWGCYFGVCEAYGATPIEDVVK